jgi:hypothetical protein
VNTALPRIVGIMCSYKLDYSSWNKFETSDRRVQVGKRVWKGLLPGLKRMSKTLLS